MEMDMDMDMEVLLVMWRRAITAVAARLPVDVGVRVSQQVRAPFAQPARRALVLLSFSAHGREEAAAVVQLLCFVVPHVLSLSRIHCLVHLRRRAFCIRIFCRCRGRPVRGGELRLAQELPPLATARLCCRWWLRCAAGRAPRQKGVTARQLLHPALQPVREVCNQCIVRDVLHREARPIPNGMVVAQLGSAELEHARKRLAAVGLVGLVRWGASAKGLGQPALPRLEAGLGQVARAIEMVRAVGLQCEGVWPRREGEVVPAHRASVATRIHCHQPVIGAQVVECPWLPQKLGKGQALV